MGLADLIGKMIPGMGGGAGGPAPNSAKAIADRADAAKQRRKPYTTNADETRVLKMLNEPRRVRQMTLEVFEPLWTKCLLYTAGIQHIQPLLGGRSWQPKKNQDWVPLPVMNEIQPKVQRVVDFFTRKRPTTYVEPQKKTEDNINAAELGDSILDVLWLKGGEDEKQDELATWLVTTGNAFKKHLIDITARSASKIPTFVEMEEPVLGMDGQPVIGANGPVMTKRFEMQRDESGAPVYEEVPQGDVLSEVVSPVAMTLPLACRNASDSPWMLETQLYSTDMLRQLFPDKAEFIPDRGQVLTSDLYVHRITSLLTTGMQGIARTVDPYYMEGFALVSLLEIAPNADHPNGILLIEMDGIPLYIGDLPLGTRYSYEHVGYYRVPGRFWHRGMVEDLIAPQDGINKLEQYLQLNDAFNVNPVWLCPINSGIPEGTIKGKPGMVYRYTYPFKPERIPGESMPPQIIQRRQMYSDDMEKISGVRDVIMGAAPPGVTAGVALNRIGEEAEGMFDPITKRFERFIERCETTKLMFVQKYYTEPRYLALEAEGGNIVEIEDFRGTDLRGNVNVRVEAGSYQPRSRAGLQQMLLDAYDRGLFPQLLTDPGQYEEFMEQLGVSGFHTEKGLDYRRAKWENEMLSRVTGYDRVIRNSGDDDIVHLVTHTNFRKTKQFLRLPNLVQMNFLRHEMEHLQALIESGGVGDPAKAAAQQDAATAAGPGGGASATAPAGQNGDQTGNGQSQGASDAVA